MIATKGKTIELLNKYNLNAKKGLGQNFLIDSNIVKKIVNEANVTDVGVIEIGPGLGSLTEQLINVASKVLVYEIDSDMVNILQENIISNNKLKIVNIDFLEADLDTDINYFNDVERVVVISNLPYYITTPIIFKLLKFNHPKINEYYFMVQKEVALRLTGKPNTKDYNSLSVLISYKADAKILFNIPKTCFYPAPDVESAVISLKRKEDYQQVEDEEEFLKFVHNIFALRRKTLVNNITAKCNFSKDVAMKLIQDEELSPTIRAEALSLAQIISLYNSSLQFKK